MNHEENEMRELLNRPAFDGAPREEHRAELRQKVLDAFDASRGAVVLSPAANTGRGASVVFRRPWPRIAAVVLVAVGVYAVFAVVSSLQPTVAFANLAEPFLRARSARFKMTIESKDVPRQTVRTLFREPNQLRQELPSGDVNIMDGKAGKFLSLKSAQKLAVLATTTDPILTKPQVPDFFDLLRTSLRTAQSDPAFKGVALGERAIDDCPAIGYRVKQPLGVMDIWGDAGTGMPILVEMTSTMLPSARITMRDFEFDVELDEALFDTRPPEGYRVETLNVAMPTEQDLIESLKLLAESNDGLFPDVFGHQAIVAFISRWVQKEYGQKTNGKKNHDKPDAVGTTAAKDLTMSLTRGLLFAATLPADAAARYAGKGVKKGDATAVVFWYKPADSARYRVVYGDLAVKDEASAPDAASGVPVTFEVSPAEVAREFQKQRPRTELPKPAPPQAPPVIGDAAPKKLEPAEPAAQKILDEMAAIYASCKSYRDSGKVTSTMIKDDGERTTSELTFTTAFRRPRRLRFEFDDKSSAFEIRYIVWTDGTQVQSWSTVNGLQKPETLGLAVAGATGVSRSASATIPALLLPGETWGSIQILPGAKLAADEQFGGMECFRIDASYGNWPMSLWIAKDSHLLLRVDTQMKVKDFRTEQTTLYKPTLDGDVPDNLLDFNPPAGK